MIAISILMPSRLQRVAVGVDSNYFFERALTSVLRQTSVVSGSISPQIIVGIDAGAELPTMAKEASIEFAISNGKSQAAALNAAAKRIEGDYVAILEDDDEWAPEFLEIATAASDLRSFVSSTQLEVDPSGAIGRVVDFPTPSGWLMPRKIWDEVGKFDESYRWHLDCEWLGRLNESGVPRVHLVEATAPDPATLARTTVADLLVGRANAKRARRGLLRLMDANSRTQLVRHRLPKPLVIRQVHGNSGTATIRDDIGSRLQSDREKQALVARFGGMPW
jgi:glycosyltransferase involved in cell wall biosynthesis